MNSQEAKEILLRHFPGQSPSDDETRHALEFARQHSELGPWLADQEEFHRSFRAALHTIAPPPGLAGQILARSKVIRPSWPRPSLLIAAAASVMLILGLLFWQRYPAEEQTFARFQSRMVGFALREYRMDIETPSESAVRTYLQEHGTPADFPLPQKLAALPVKGGASLAWKGQPVSMLCFDWQGKETLYLFVIEQRQIEEGIPETAHVAPYKGVTTASWKSGEVLCLLVGEPPEEILRALL